MYGLVINGGGGYPFPVGSNSVNGAVNSDFPLPATG
jgi:hypothetical protein